MGRTMMWLRAPCAVVLVLALGCADDGNTGETTDPVGGGGLGGLGAAGAIAAGSGNITPPPATISGGAGGAITAPKGGAGAGGMAGTTVGTDPDRVPEMTAGAGAGGMAGMTAGAGAGGMAGTMAGAGGTMAPGGVIREADPTDASTLARAGEYEVDSYWQGLRAPEQYGGGTVYYPTSAEAKPPFGVVAVVPGFTAYQSSIDDWGPFLASHGIVTITIDTITTADPPSQRALGLMDALETVKAENTRAGSPLMGKINADALGVAGWSMGGGGALIAAANNPTLKAAVGFAAWGPSGGAKNTVPVLAFEATLDILAASMSDGYYNQTPETTPKMLFEVAGAGHSVANSPHNHEGIIGQYGLSWFKVFLEGDERYRKFLTAGKPAITTSKFATNVK